jgi:4-amino-4-deoxy-L-arabinose transferase-like glycosyltransferase
MVLLPEEVLGATVRFGRYGFLDPVAELFVVAYLFLLWQWFTSTRQRAWLLAAASGVAIGCAAASKENGALAAVRSIVAVNRAAGRLRRIQIDPAMTVYEVTGPLIKPTPAQIVAQPPTNLAAGC